MKKTLIIAEAGVNHNGSFELAKKLIDAAKEAGADIVKFQTAIPEMLVTEQGEKAAYQKDNTDNSTESQLDMLKKILLPIEDFHKLKDYCDEVGIEFLSTAFEMVSLEMLKDMGLKIFKIPSGEITNLPYLEYIGELNLDVILSTGMAEMHEIKAALDVLIESGTHKDKITILHCTTDYPTKMSDVNLKAMLSIKQEFGVNIGYSDHTLGIEVSTAAVTMGATVIEKHFTLDKTMVGPDHAASLEPDELKQLVYSIRNVEIALSGDGIKKPTEREKANISIARKSIHIANDIKKGDVIKAEDLIMKRPGSGISPMEMDEVIGKRAVKDLAVDYKLKLEDLV